MPGTPEGPMEERDKLALTMFLLFALGFGVQIASVWPLLVAHLNVANWIALILIHLALLSSMLNLYFKASKRTLVQRVEVLLAAGLALMASGADFSLFWKIGGR